MGFLRCPTVWCQRKPWLYRKAGRGPPSGPDVRYGQVASLFRPVSVAVVDRIRSAAEKT